MKTLILTLILIIVLMFTVTFAINSYSYQNVIPNEKAILAIIGEAENQGSQGMLAVACGISNRGSLHGVYGLNSPRVKNKLYSKQTYQLAMSSWNHAIESDTACDFLGGADHWENIKAFGKPYWEKDMVETYRYKDHVFYRRK